MSVNRKGEKFNFESAPTDSYKSGLKIGEKTWSLDQIFIIVVVVVAVVVTHYWRYHDTNGKCKVVHQVRCKWRLLADE